MSHLRELESSPESHMKLNSSLAKSIASPPHIANRKTWVITDTSHGHESIMAGCV